MLGGREVRRRAGVSPNNAERKAAGRGREMDITEHRGESSRVEACQATEGARVRGTALSAVGSGASCSCGTVPGQVPIVLLRPAVREELSHVGAAAGVVAAGGKGVTLRALRRQRGAAGVGVCRKRCDCGLLALQDGRGWVVVGVGGWVGGLVGGWWVGVGVCGGVCVWGGGGGITYGAAWRQWRRRGGSSAYLWLLDHPPAYSARIAVLPRNAKASLRLGMRCPSTSPSPTTYLYRRGVEGGRALVPKRLLRQAKRRAVQVAEAALLEVVPHHL